MNASMNIPTTLPGILDEDLETLAAYADHEANPLYPVPILWNAKQLIPLYKAVQEDTSHEHNRNTVNTHSAA